MFTLIYYINFDLVFEKYFTLVFGQSNIHKYINCYSHFYFFLSITQFFLKNRKDWILCIDMMYICMCIITNPKYNFQTSIISLILQCIYDDISGLIKNNTKTRSGRNVSGSITVFYITYYFFNIVSFKVNSLFSTILPPLRFSEKQSWSLK